MNTLIMCEGKSDAVMIGYFIINVKNYKHVKHSIGLNIVKIERSYKSNEYISIYEKSGNYITIWGIGGKDCFKSAADEFYNMQIKSNKEKRYNQLIIIHDRDDFEDDTIIIKKLNDNFSKIGFKLQNNTVVTGKYKDSYNENYDISALTVIIPDSECGSLENVIITSISENAEDKVIVEKCSEFIDNIKPLANKYITTKRIQLKAQLSTIFSILSPEKVFDFIDEILTTTVKWEETLTFCNCFNYILSII